MKVKKQLLIIITWAIISLFIINIYAQTAIPSPNAYSAAQYASTPVSNYTGIPAINIPVYTVNDEGVVIPISLSYHASGIKVEQEASWVGLGWILNAGGVISKITIGKEDDECHYRTTGYQTPTIYDQPFWPTAFTGDYVEMPAPACPEYCNPPITYCNEAIDDAIALGEILPDVYYFNFYGYTGKFIMNYQTGEPFIAMEGSGIKFIPFGEYNPVNWKAIALDGTEFFFYEVEVQTSEVFDEDGTPIEDNQVTVKNYYLTQIQFPNGKLVTFDYQTYPEVKSVISLSEKMIAEWRDYVQAPDPNYTETDIEKIYALNRYNPVYLNQITTSNYTIDFVTTFNRDDIENGLRLESINITSGTNSKTFDFTYDYFTGSNVGGNYLDGTNFSWLYTDDELRKRLKLVSFGENGREPYVFDYNQINLPLKTSYAKDFWGNYNGIDNNITLIPRIADFVLYDSYYK